MAVDALGRGYDPVALIDPATGLPVTVSGGGGGGGGGSGVTDNVLSTYTITATGAQPGVLTTGYGSVLVELTGTFSATINLQGSSDSTDGVNGTWINLFGFLSEDTGGLSAAINLTSSQRKRLYRAQDAMWVRVNTSSFTSGTVTGLVTRRIAPISERAVYVGNSLTASINAGSSVIGSTTLRAAGTNRSATVTTTAANLMATNANRQGWKIKNDSAGDIWINFDTTATATPGGGNIKIPAGGYLASEPGFIETGAMSAIGSAAGLNITAREH